MDKWLLAFTTLSFLLQLSFITQCKMDFIRILLKQILSLQQNIIIRLSHTNTKFLSTIYKYLKTKQNTEIFIEKIKIYTFFLNESQTYDNGVQTVHLPHKFITIYNNIQCEKLFRITSSTEDLNSLICCSSLTQTKHIIHNLIITLKKCAYINELISIFCLQEQRNKLQ